MAKQESVRTLSATVNGKCFPDLQILSEALSHSMWRASCPFWASLAEWANMLPNLESHLA
ncbi:MAG: hypothetical protein Aurels2KO_03130 [Aureliella sp.]